MDVNYMLRLKSPINAGSWEAVETMNRNIFDILRRQMDRFPMEIIRCDETYGVMMVKGLQSAVETMYGIKLTYAPHEEPMGTQFPESTTLLEKSWRIEGTPVIPPELQELVAELIIH